MTAEFKDDKFIVHDPIHGDIEYVVVLTNSKRGKYHKIYYSKIAPTAYNKTILSIGGFRVRTSGVLNGRINHMGIELVFNTSNIAAIPLRPPIPKRNKYRLK